MTQEVTPTREQVKRYMAQVFALVQACPAGRVTTYGWIAKAIGYPRGARMVGWIMHETPQDIPAQRVINSKGELTGSKAFGQIGRMRQLLEAENITFSEDGRVDMKRYGWDPMRDLTEDERQQVLATVPANTPEPDDRLLYLLQNDPASPLRASS
jgi:methylated-DNA-protein-cysteine methyltransferase-like protein